MRLAAIPLIVGVWFWIASCNSQRSDAISTMRTTETVRGVWQREFEEDPIGDADNADRETLVFWTQAPKSGIYVDIRLPKGSPGRQSDSSNIAKDPSALQARGMSLPLSDDDDDNVLSILLRQKSFAGILEFRLGDTTDSKQALAKDQVLVDLADQAASSSKGALPLCTCFWKRHMDYQPPSGGLDIGVCASRPPNPDGSIDLRETGDDGSYAEGWHRLPGSEKGPYWACQLLTEDGVERTGYWVRTGKYFAYAIGRPTTAESAEQLNCAPKSVQVQQCVGKKLEQAVHGLLGEENSKASMESILAIVGTYVCVFGEIIPVSNGSSETTVQWKILYSTDPRLVGCTLLGSGPDLCSTLSQEASAAATTTTDKKSELQEGDAFCQTVVSGGCVRRWQVMEVDDASAMMKDLPGLL